MKTIPQTNKQIIENFLTRRDHERFALKKKEEKLCEAIPELTELKVAQDLAGVDFARARIKGNKDAQAIFDALCADLMAKRRKLLAEHNIPEDYLTPVYHCDLCHDNGYVDGKLCQCLRRIIAEASFSRYDLKPQAKAENFDVLSLDVYPKEHLKTYNGIHQLFKKYCANFDLQSENYLFTGNPGRGKTFLSNCIVNALIDQGYDIIYITAAHLVKLVQEVMHEESSSVSELYHALLSCDLLVIDDFGAEYTTKFSGSQLFDIINSRLLRKGKMIISTNLTLNEIMAQYDARLSSRIRGNFKTVPFYGDDIRLIKKRQQS